MAMVRLGCDRCDWSATTRGPEHGAAGGTVAHLYCARCGVVRACALGNALPHGPFGVPLGPRHGQASRLARVLARRVAGVIDPLAAARCPVCHGGNLILTPPDGQSLLCPRCGEGRLRAVPTSD